MVKRKPIHAKYDQFGGYSNKPETYKIKGPKSKTWIIRQNEDYEILHPIAVEIGKLIIDSNVYHYWQKQVKAAFRKIAKSNKQQSMNEDIQRIYAVLAEVHDYYVKFRPIITSEIRTILPDGCKSFDPQLCGLYLENVKHDLKEKRLLEQVDKFKKPPYVEINLARRLLIVADKNILLSSDNVWNFIKELCDSCRRDESPPATKNWKNARYQLQRLLKREVPEYYDDLWPKVLLTVGKKYYKLGDFVKIIFGAQIGIHRTK